MNPTSIKFHKRNAVLDRVLLSVTDSRVRIQMGIRIFVYNGIYIQTHWTLYIIATTGISKSLPS
jgi:hypothetical protein